MGGGFIERVGAVCPLEIFGNEIAAGNYSQEEWQQNVCSLHTLKS
jgi:hypothetical protein